MTDEARARALVKQWRDEEWGYWQGGSVVGTGRLTDLIAAAFAAVREACAQVAEDEPELPGEMPDEMQEAMNSHSLEKPDAELFCRGLVSVTKRSIAAAIRSDQSRPSEGEG